MTPGCTLNPDASATYGPLPAARKRASSPASGAGAPSPARRLTRLVLSPIVCGGHRVGAINTKAPAELRTRLKRALLKCKVTFLSG